MADLPKPNTDTEVYLAAVVDRLDKVLQLLTPQRASGRASALDAAPPLRKRVSGKRST